MSQNEVVFTAEEKHELATKAAFEQSWIDEVLSCLGIVFSQEATMRADLRMNLLIRIMGRPGELRAKHPELVDTRDFIDLVSEVSQLEGDFKALYYLDRHLIFLTSEGYLVTIGSQAVDGIRIVRLTNQGEKFVQPELSEFGKEQLLPEVVKSIERQILTYPVEKRDDFLFELRDSIAKNRAEIVAKLLVEGLPRLLGGLSP